MTHPRVEIAAALIGVWRGEGHGETPRPFDFADRWEIVDLGKPFSPTAKRVSRIVRRFRLSGDDLTYEMDMAWSDGPYERHLTSTLHRA